MGRKRPDSVLASYEDLCQAHSRLLIECLPPAASSARLSFPLSGEKMEGSYRRETICPHSSAYKGLSRSEM